MDQFEGVQFTREFLEMKDPYYGHVIIGDGKIIMVAPSIPYSQDCPYGNTTPYSSAPPTYGLVEAEGSW